MSSEFINIRTKEEPKAVPAKALSPETAEGKEYWEMVATGSVSLEDQTLDLLLEKINEEKH